MYNPIDIQVCVKEFLYSYPTNSHGDYLTFQKIRAMCEICGYNKRL
jgi:hypothetical protein